MWLRNLKKSECKARYSKIGILILLHFSQGIAASYEELDPIEIKVHKNLNDLIVFFEHISVVERCSV